MSEVWLALYVFIIQLAYCISLYSEPDADFPKFVDYLRHNCMAGFPQIGDDVLQILAHSEEPVLANATFSPYWENIGWSVFSGGFDTPATNEDRYHRMYAMGTLEGLLSAEYMWLFYHLNTEKMIGRREERTTTAIWMKEQYFGPILDNFMERDHNHRGCHLEAEYFDLAHGYYCQLLGIMDGYNAVVEQNAGAKYTSSSPKAALSFLDILALNADGQLPELEQISVEHPSVREIRLHRSGSSQFVPSVPQRCSALTRLVRNQQGVVTDVISAHTTWESFPEMVRVMKDISAPMVMQERSDATVQFSSYPGCISSTDDWVVRPSTWLVSFETTTNILKPGRFGTPESTPDFIRVMIAVSLAHDTPSWKDLMETCDVPSGTYNSQWIVVDYEKVKEAVDQGLPDLPSGTALVLETAPGAGEDEYGFYASEDISKLINEKGYFPGFNEAMLSSSRTHLGYERSYPQDKRAETFQQLAHKVNSVATMYSVMQFNEPGNRGSIAPLNSADGGADVKITSLATMKEKGGTWAYSGPPRMSGYGPEARQNRNEYVEREMARFFGQDRIYMSWEFPLVLFVPEDHRMCISQECPPNLEVNPRDLPEPGSEDEATSVVGSQCGYLCLETE
ncbi:hypothetical protein FOL47_007093 [Perkinsus chesapeaki]|uniref:Phospholipase B-like n=1 Tax=Perkinsus chesapeaki TaxID=330153 RepID=A0A7J6LMQ2_PERCH|nr:hypothetical protein FOL47_007093 [Perkinsus chesapeaki]